MSISSKARRARAAFVADLARRWPCIKGSLALVRKPCIRPECPACQEGRKHPSHLLTFRLDGKTQCRYVPSAWVAPLRKALANGRWIERRLAELSGEVLDLYRDERTQNERARRVGRKKSLERASAV